MAFSVSIATEDDVAAIAALRNSVAEQLIIEYGNGHWSSCVKESAVLRDLRTSKTFIARVNGILAGTFRFATKKPWAIDLKYFTPVSKALYLHDMAISPAMQRLSLGKQIIAEAIDFARSFPCEAIRLDAYDAPAGAGPFYSKCGFNEVGRVTYRGVPLIYFEMLLSQP
jgi:GNAT superfamily N-acetyltransferase